VAGIGVEHLAALVLAEDADILLVGRRDGPNRIVVVRLACGEFLGAESAWRE
jgi:hypothetical protein